MVGRLGELCSTLLCLFMHVHRIPSGPRASFFLALTRIWYGKKSQRIVALTG